MTKTVSGKTEVWLDERTSKKLVYIFLYVNIVDTHWNYYCFTKTIPVNTHELFHREIRKKSNAEMLNISSYFLLSGQS